MIPPEDILHIARLARITLTPDEVGRFTHELSNILEFAATLEEVDTTAVEALTGGTAIENAFRDDQPGDALGADAALLIESAPAHHDGYVAVKAVFDRT